MRSLSAKRRRLPPRYEIVLAVDRHLPSRTTAKRRGGARKTLWTAKSYVCSIRGHLTLMA